MNTQNDQDWQIPVEDQQLTDIVENCQLDSIHQYFEERSISWNDFTRYFTQQFRLLSGEEDNNVEPLYEPIDASFVHDIKQNDFHKNYISSLNYLPLQNVFITTGTDGLAKIWSGDLSTSQVICTIDHVQSLQTQATRGEVDIIEQIKANDDEERAKNIRSQIGINSDQYQNASISINSSKQQNDKNISESIPKQKSQQSNIAMHLGRPRPGQNISQTVEKEQTQEDTKDKTQKNLTFENYRLKKASQTKDNRMANYANAIKGAFDMKDHAILYKLYADTPATIEAEHNNRGYINTPADARLQLENKRKRESGIISTKKNDNEFFNEEVEDEDQFDNRMHNVMMNAMNRPLVKMLTQKKSENSIATQRLINSAQLTFRNKTFLQSQTNQQNYLINTQSPLYNSRTSFNFRQNRNSLTSRGQAADNIKINQQSIPQQTKYVKQQIIPISQQTNSISQQNINISNISTPSQQQQINIQISDQISGISDENRENQNKISINNDEIISITNTDNITQRTFNDKPCIKSILDQQSSIGLSPGEPSIIQSKTSALIQNEKRFLNRLTNHHIVKPQKKSNLGNQYTQNQGMMIEHVTSDKIWIISVVVFPSNGWFGLISSDRSISFYQPDRYLPKGRLRNLDSMPQCACVIGSKESWNKREMLLIGRKDGVIDIISITEGIMTMTADLSSRKDRSLLNAKLKEKNDYINLPDQEEENIDEDERRKRRLNAIKILEKEQRKLIDEEEEDEDEDQDEEQKERQLTPSSRYNDDKTNTQIKSIKHSSSIILSHSQNNNIEQQQIQFQKHQLNDKGTKLKLDINKIQSLEICPPSSSSESLSSNEYLLQNEFSFQKSNSQFLQKSNSQFLQKSNSQFLQKSNSQFLQKQTLSSKRKRWKWMLFNEDIQKTIIFTPRVLMKFNQQNKIKARVNSRNDNKKRQIKAYNLISGMNADETKELEKYNDEDRDMIMKEQLIRLRHKGEISALRAHNSNITRIMNIIELNQVLTCSLDSVLRLWDLDHMEAKWTMKGGHNNKGITCCCWSSNYKVVVSGGIDYNLCIWDALQHKKIVILHGHTSIVIDICIDDHSGMIISVGNDGMIRIWDLLTNLCVQKLSSYDISCGFTFRKISYFKPSGDILLASKRLNGWRHTSMMGKNISAHKDDVIILLFNPVFEQLISIDLLNVINVWGVRSGRNIFRFKAKSSGSITCACFDLMGRKLFTGDTNGIIQMYNPSQGKLLKEFSQKGEQARRTTLSKDMNNNSLDNNIDQETDLKYSHTSNFTDKIKNAQSKVDSTGLIISLGIQENKVKNQDSDLNRNQSNDYPNLNVINHLCVGSTRFVQEQIMSVGSNKQIRAIDNANNSSFQNSSEKVFHGPYHSYHGQNIRCAAFQPPDNLAVCDDDGNLILWNSETGYIKQSLRQGEDQKQENDDKNGNGIINERRINEKQYQNDNLKPSKKHMSKREILLNIKKQSMQKSPQNHSQLQEKQNALKTEATKKESLDIEMMLNPKAIVMQVVFVAEYRGLLLTHSLDGCIRVWSLKHASELLSLQTGHKQGIMCVNSWNQNEAEVQKWHDSYEWEKAQEQRLLERKVEGFDENYLKETEEWENECYFNNQIISQMKTNNGELHEDYIQQQNQQHESLNYWVQNGMGPGIGDAATAAYLAFAGAYSEVMILDLKQLMQIARKQEQKLNIFQQNLNNEEQTAIESHGSNTLKSSQLVMNSFTDTTNFSSKTLNDQINPLQMHFSQILLHYWRAKTQKDHISSITFIKINGLSMQKKKIEERLKKKSENNISLILNQQNLISENQSVGKLLLPAHLCYPPSAQEVFYDQSQTLRNEKEIEKQQQMIDKEFEKQLTCPIDNNSLFLACAIDKFIMLFSLDGALLGSYGARVLNKPSSIKQKLTNDQTTSDNSKEQEINEATNNNQDKEGEKIKELQNNDINMKQLNEIQAPTNQETINEKQLPKSSSQIDLKRKINTLQVNPKDYIVQPPLWQVLNNIPIIPLDDRKLIRLKEEDLPEYLQTIHIRLPQNQNLKGSTSQERYLSRINTNHSLNLGKISNYNTLRKMSQTLNFHDLKEQNNMIQNDEIETIKEEKQAKTKNKNQIKDTKLIQNSNIENKENQDNIKQQIHNLGTMKLMESKQLDEFFEDNSLQNHKLLQPQIQYNRYENNINFKQQQKFDPAKIIEKRREKMRYIVIKQKFDNATFNDQQDRDQQNNRSVSPMPPVSISRNESPELIRFQSSPFQLNQQTQQNLNPSLIPQNFHKYIQQNQNVSSSQDGSESPDWENDSNLLKSFDISSSLLMQSDRCFQIPKSQRQAEEDRMIRENQRQLNSHDQSQNAQQITQKWTPQSTRSITHSFQSKKNDNPIYEQKSITPEKQSTSPSLQQNLIQQLSQLQHLRLDLNDGVLLSSIHHSVPSLSPKLQQLFIKQKIEDQYTRMNVFKPNNSNLYDENEQFSYINGTNQESTGQETNISSSSNWDQNEQF